ncbi:MAG: hypothetical protein M3Z17_01835 [Gemmatimonadota bacterium]|nr:hypothetical protein [Gemmatimonadota bacterium]
MDRINSRIATIYGYAVCLICVIVILVSTHSVIDAAFDYANPAGATSYGGAGALSSYEMWRVEFDARRSARPNGPAAPDTSLSEKELHQLYQSQRTEQLDSARFRALRSLISNLVFLALATTMFLLHWRWIRRTNNEPSVS